MTDVLPVDGRHAMTKRTMIRALSILIAVVLVLMIWAIRVVYINRAYNKNVTILEMDSYINYGSFRAKAVESELMTSEEFEDRFGVDINKEGLYRIMDKEDRLICLRFHVENIAGEILQWDDVLTFGEGFETITWSSVSIPDIERYVNIVYDDAFRPDEEVDFWHITVVSRNMFRMDTWNSLDTSDFYFTLSKYPEAVRIRLK